MNMIVGALSTILNLLFWVAIVVLLIKKAKKTASRPKEQPVTAERSFIEDELPDAPAPEFTPKPGSTPAQIRLQKMRFDAQQSLAANENIEALRPPVPKQYSPDNVRRRPTKSENYGALCRLLGEDRSGDWMAKQMNEEKRLLRHNTLDLGGMHETVCAADALKQSHRGHCAAGTVDTPEIL